MQSCHRLFLTYMQYAYNLGYLKILHVILIENINGLQEGDKYLPIPQSRTTERR